MNENLTLEENQQKEFEQVIAKYTFSVEVAGATNEERPLLNVEKRGITLHFLRYGLFDLISDYKAPTTSYSSPDSAEHFKSIFVDEQDKAVVAKVINEPANETSEQQPEIEPSIPLDEVIINGDIPDNENFNIARTPLRAGYVYMINEATPLDDFKEFRVDDYGMLYEIDWSKNKKEGKYLDQRKDDGKAMMYKILDRNDQTYYFAYSPVQWSATYVNELLTDQEKRKQRCKTKILCKGIPKNEGSNDIAVTQYNETYIVVEDSNPMAYKYSEVLHNIADVEQKEDEGGENTLLEDMFITLDDPMGCADVMCVGIDREITRLKALMVSLQTGKSVTEIFPYLIRNQQVPVDDIEKTKQIQYMHRLAQLTYDFVYNNHENAEKYSSDLIKSTVANVALDLTIGSYIRPFIEQNGVKIEKLEKLLAVVERKAQRDVINSFRDDLGNLMKSDYYQDATDNFINSIADSIETAKEIIAIHTIALGNYPNMHDRHLDLKTVYEPTKDNWYVHINETLYNKNPSIFKKSTKILDLKIDLQDIKVLSLSKKTVSAIDKIIKAYANHQTYLGPLISLRKKSLPINGKISYFRDKHTRVATFKFSALDEFESTVKNRRLTVNINGEKVSLNKFKKYWHVEYKKMSQQSTEALIKSGKLEFNVETKLPKRFKTEAEKVLKSNAFGGIIVIIEGIVWAKAVNEFSKEKSFKNFEKLGFASIKLGAASLSLIEKMKLYDKHLANKGVNSALTIKKIDNFKLKIGVLKIASSLITVYTASRDSYQSFSVRDDDTAALYGMAAGLGAVFLLADVSALIGGGITVFAIGFWPAALLGGVMIGCYYVAQKYFKDTQLEGYFKNFPLSDYALFPEPNELPHTYINRLFANKTYSVIEPWFETVQSQEYKTYSNFEKAYTAFLDIAIPSMVIVEPDVEEYTNYRKGFDKHNVITNRFKALLYSAQKINEVDDLDIKAWFYPHGIKAPLKDNHRFEITTFIYNFPKETFNFNKEKLTPNCIISFGLPRQFYWDYREYHNGEILFTCRLRTDDTNYTPTNFNKEARFIFGSAQLHNRKDNNSKHMTSIFSAHRYNQRVNVRSVKLLNTPKEEAPQKPNIVSENSIKMLQSYNLKL